MSVTVAVFRGFLCLAVCKYWIPTAFSSSDIILKFGMPSNLPVKHWIFVWMFYDYRNWIPRTSKVQLRNPLLIIPVILYYIKGPHIFASRLSSRHTGWALSTWFFAWESGSVDRHLCIPSHGWTEVNVEVQFRPVIWTTACHHEPKVSTGERPRPKTLTFLWYFWHRFPHFCNLK